MRLKNWNFERIAPYIFEGAAGADSLKGTDEDAFISAA